MAYWIIWLWARIFLRLYFRRTLVYGLDRVPPTGPLILAANHPSAFLEASVLATVLNRDLYFLVRGDMFHKRFMWLFKWTHQIPIFRQKDGIQNLRKNASSFDLTYQYLGEGKAVLIFPEAKTILEKKMRPIQRGTAHLAFGTLPYIKDGSALKVQPVGVNFTEPRMAGTEVVVDFGEPFTVNLATREDRIAIEQFTQTLSERMSPLIVQVHDQGYEHHYEILASVYFAFLFARKRSKADVPKDLHAISEIMNDRGRNPALVHQVHEYWHQLKAKGLKDALYFPAMLTRSRLVLGIELVIKAFWILAGGWIWLLLKSFIFGKIRTATFQAPTAVGAAMVVYVLISLILLLVLLITSWPIWILPAWWLVLMTGLLVRSPWTVIWRSLFLSGRLKRKMKKEIVYFKTELEKELA